MKFSGTVFRYGRDVDTDVIIPARYLNSSDHAHLAAHAMEDIAIKAAGVSCVIAKSFARIFYRNAINVGLPILECPAAVDAIAAGDAVDVDTEDGSIVNRRTGERFTAEPFPPFIAEIIEAGGLVERTRAKLAAADAAAGAPAPAGE